MKRYDATIMAREPVMIEQCSGDYVRYSEAQARIEALEWLVEVQDVLRWVGSVESDDCTERDCNAHDEAYQSYLSARASAGV